MHNPCARFSILYKCICTWIGLVVYIQIYKISRDLIQLSAWLCDRKRHQMLSMIGFSYWDQSQVLRQLKDSYFLPWPFKFWNNARFKNNKLTILEPEFEVSHRDQDGKTMQTQICWSHGNQFQLLSGRCLKLNQSRKK